MFKQRRLEEEEEGKEEEEAKCNSSERRRERSTSETNPDRGETGRCWGGRRPRPARRDAYFCNRALFGTKISRNGAAGPFGVTRGL